MTLPAVLALSIAGFIVYFGFLVLGISRGPGWRAYRWFGYAAMAAALYLVCDMPVTLAVSDEVIVWSSRLTLASAGVFGCCWYPYLAEMEGRTLSRLDQGVVVAASLTALLSLVPDLVISRHVTSMEVDWLGASYRDAEPTVFGILIYAEYSLLLVALVVRLARSAWAGNRAAGIEALGVALLLATAVSDALVAARVIDLPYLIAFGFLSVVMAVGSVCVWRFVGDARTLEVSSRELREAQQRLVQSERLAALGELSAVIAHEVRNPLGVIYNAVSQLRRPGSAERDSSPLLEMIQEEAERLNRMVGMLLEFARPSRPTLVGLALERVLVSAGQAVTSAANVAANEVRIEVGAALPEVLGDEQLLRQALINLVENAICAPGRRSPVSVQARFAAEAGAIVLTVSDDGTGIPSGLEEKIFTPFFTTRARGTGLGLAIVRRIAEAHGGRVTAAARPGGGATFTLELPANADRATAAA